MLQFLLSFPIILVVLSIVGFSVYKLIKCLIKYPGILLGTFQLLQSPSGVFGLLTLFAITLVTIKQPSVGGTAFVAFCAIIPAALGFFEHKEQMLQIQQSVLVPPPGTNNPGKPNNEPPAA
jgi:hypothetical protein